METGSSGDEQVLDELAALADEASRIKFLSLRQSLLSRSTVERLDDAVRALLRTDLTKAASLAEAALTIAHQLGDQEALAHALRARANVFWFKGQNKQAAELHPQAVQLFEQSGRSLEAARTLSSSIQPLIYLGEYERAMQAADRARAIFTAAGDTLRLARLEINVGNIFHRQDRFQEALACYERAYRQLQPDKDAEGIMAALQNIAMCLICLNDYARALSTYETVRKFCLEQNTPLEVAKADYNIAYLYYFRGEYGPAIERLRTARESAEKFDNPYFLALCYLDLSEIYVELNLSEEAVEMAQEAFSRFQKLEMGYESAKALCNIAIALSQQQKAFRALEIFAQSRTMFVKEKNQVWPSLIDLYQALVYFEEGRLYEARRFCQAALEFFRNSPLPGRAILCRVLLARISLKANEVDAARRECSAALEEFTGKEAPVLAYQAHFVMGQIEEAAQHWEEARKQYQTAKQVIETLWSGLHGEELKIAFMRNRLEIYEDLVNLCLMNSGHPASQVEAWNYIEQAKSRTLRELVSHRVAPLVAQDSARSDLVRRIRTLREQLNWYYHRIQAEQLGQTPSSDQRLLELHQQAQEREKEFLRVLRENVSSGAELASVEETKPIALDALRGLLGAETTLLEFFRVRDRILAVLVTQEGLDVVPLTLVSRIVTQLRMLQFQFSKFRLGPAYVREFQDTLFRATQAHLKELYSELLAPFRSRLNGGHLIVVPHELLHYVPFHALFDGEKYLVDSMTVSYAPSASIYAHCHQKNAYATGPSLILGVPDPQNPCILEELQSVSMILPNAELFLGAKADEKVLRDKGPRSRLIHIATHGFFRQDNPMFSGIRLGDSYLNLYDLYSLDLPADLIVLSGCSTGLNVIAAGDELLGLARGLLYAGARSLLLTLWDVNDTSTAQFMRLFYTHFHEVENRAEALRRAMRGLREFFPHPYYWAPFILVGKVFPSSE